MSSARLRLAKFIIIVVAVLQFAKTTCALRLVARAWTPKWRAQPAEKDAHTEAAMSIFKSNYLNIVTLNFTRPCVGVVAVAWLNGECTHTHTSAPILPCKSADPHSTYSTVYGTFTNPCTAVQTSESVKIT